MTSLRVIIWFHHYVCCVMSIYLSYSIYLYIFYLRRASPSAPTASKIPLRKLLWHDLRSVSRGFLSYMTPYVLIGVQRPLMQPILQVCFYFTYFAWLCSTDV